jgi:hypothetical protein
MCADTTRLQLLITMACLSLVYCSVDEREPRNRDVSLVQQHVDTITEAPAIVARQRDLFAALVAGRDIDELLHRRFTIRNAYSGALEDSSTVAARRRQASLFEALNVRVPFDTSVITQAGDLMAYTEFQVLHLSASQVVVLARDDHGYVLLTNWIGSGADWRAIGMVLNPSPAALDRLYDRATEWSGR